RRVRFFVGRRSLRFPHRVSKTFLLLTNISGGETKPMRHRILSGFMIIFLAGGLLGGLLAPAFAQGPQPDPAGIATGDKNNVVDAGGNAFVVPEPTDQTAPDYADKKKAYDEYQAQ